MRIFLIVMVILSGILTAGETSKFKSSKAKSAQKNYERDLETAKKKYLISLKSALKSGLKTGDLDECKLIDSEIKLLENVSKSSPMEKIVGKWKSPWGNAVMTISVDGKVENTSKYPEFRSGKIKVRGDDEYELEWVGGQINTYILEDKGSSLYYAIKKERWTKLE